MVCSYARRPHGEEHHPASPSSVETLIRRTVIERVTRLELIEGRENRMRAIQDVMRIVVCTRQLFALRHEMFRRATRAKLEEFIFDEGEAKTFGPYLTTLVRGSTAVAESQTCVICGRARADLLPCGCVAHWQCVQGAGAWPCECAQIDDYIP